MEELFDKIGIRMEMWLVSLFSATLFTLYRIYEPEKMPAVRKVVSIIIMGLISALLVPGLVVNYFSIENPFTAAAITGITVYSFEQVVILSKKKLLKGISNKTDTEDGNN